MKAFTRYVARAGIATIAALALVACNGDNDDDTVNFTPSTSTETAGGGTTTIQQQRVDAFAATLDGGQEVPPNDSAAEGSGTVVIDADTLQMTAAVTTSDLAGTAAHIHVGAVGESGPIVFPLTETEPGSGVWTTSAALTQDQYDTLLAGEYYFNVHSTAFPDGEIRGQILTQRFDTAESTDGTGTTDPNATVTTEITDDGTTVIVNSRASGFFAALRGEHEVPPNASTAQGSAAVVIDPETRQLLAAVTTSGVAGTAAHIHQAPVGENGPVIIPLEELVAASGIWFATATLTEEQYSALRAGNMYFNVHSAAYPDGEIRGQILAQRQFSTTVTVTTDTGSSSTTGTIIGDTADTTGSGASGTTPPITPTTTDNITSPTGINTTIDTTTDFGTSGSAGSSTGTTTDFTSTGSVTGSGSAVSGSTTGSTVFDPTPTTGTTGSLTTTTGSGTTDSGTASGTGSTNMTVY